MTCLSVKKWALFSRSSLYIFFGKSINWIDYFDSLGFFKFYKSPYLSINWRIKIISSRPIIEGSSRSSKNLRYIFVIMFLRICFPLFSLLLTFELSFKNLSVTEYKFKPYWTGYYFMSFSRISKLSKNCFYVYIFKFFKLGHLNSSDSILFLGMPFENCLIF